MLVWIIAAWVLIVLIYGLIASERSSKFKDKPPKGRRNDDPDPS